jgi:hypothetical protein
MKKEVEEFCRKYDATVGASSQRRRRHRLVTMQEWEADPFEPTPTWDVAIVEIHMPEDRFRALMEHDHWLAHAGLHDNNHFQNNVMRVSNLIVDHERECRIRQEHPGVRAAWEQYQVMLRLVDPGQ